MDFENIIARLKDINPNAYFGQVTAVKGLFIEVSGVRAAMTIGDRCLVHNKSLTGYLLRGLHHPPLS